MKKLTASLFLVPALIACILTSCDKNDKSAVSCTDDTLKRSTSILLGDVLERCVNGKWYAVRKCGDSPECTDQADHRNSENIDL